MRVRLLYFGVLREVMAGAPPVLELEPGATVATLLDLLAGLSCGPRPDRFWDTLAVAVNQRYASRTDQLTEGDEVALLPPVSGGAPADVVLTREPLDAAQVAEILRHPEDGATVIFDGTVRNNTRGRQTLFLDYDAYEEMALRQMQALAAEALTRYAVRAVAIRHRIGRLEIGETSVVIGVASAHRGAAFDACRWLIDTLKKTVPIWKKEHFSDGAVWADGEPFPELFVP